MDINYVFWATRHVVKAKEYESDEIIYSTHKVSENLFYINNGIALDLVTKEKLPIDYIGLNYGQHFVDIRGQIYSLHEIIDVIKFNYNIDIQLKNKMSRKKIIKLIYNVYKDIQNKEIEKEKIKTLIRINELGGKK